MQRWRIKAMAEKKRQRTTRQRTQNAECHKTDLQAVPSIWQRGETPAQFQPRNQLKLLGQRHVMLLHEPSEEGRRGFLRNDDVFVHDDEARLERWFAVDSARALSLCRLLNVFGAEEKLKLELAHMLWEKGNVFNTAGDEPDPVLGQPPPLEKRREARADQPRKPDCQPPGNARRVNRKRASTRP